MVFRMRQKLFLSIVVCVFGNSLCAQQPVPAQPPQKAEDKPMQLDEDAQAWIRTLLTKVGDKNSTISESARAGLVSIGKPALVALKKWAEGDNKMLADAAKQVIREIEERGEGIAKLPPFPGGGLPMIPGGGGPGGPGGPPKGGRFIDDALQGLKLTEAKEAKVKEVLTVHQKRILDSIQKVFQGGKPDPMAIEAAISKVHDEIAKDLEGVLSKEELETLRKNLDRKGKFPALPGGPPPK